MNRESLVELIQKIGFSRLLADKNTYLHKQIAAKIYITFKDDVVEIYFFRNNLVAIFSYEEINPVLLFTELDKLINKTDRYDKIKTQILRDYKLDLLI
jgi:hypothetical protein